ncbi:hypothetical protein BJX64DRAFT_255191 [Aspergillus heterothallicus]
MLRFLLRKAVDVPIAYLGCGLPRYQLSYSCSIEENSIRARKPRSLSLDFRLSSYSSRGRERRTKPPEALRVGSVSSMTQSTSTGRCLGHLSGADSS